jgi:VWFA-related protein
MDWRIAHKSRWAIILVLVLGLVAPAVWAQSSGNQGQSPASAQSQQGQSQPNPSQPSPSQSDQDIPDAPSAVQPPPPPSAIPQPTNPSHAVPPSQAQAEDDSASHSNQATQPPPKMPPVQTVPPGTIPRNQLNPAQGLFTLPPVSVGFVLIPVMVKDTDGRLVEGLGPTDFSVLDNGRKMTLTYFTSDPFLLSAAIVVDMGMHEVTLKKVYETLTSLVGAFSPYDEYSLYTYSSTVTQTLDFTNKPQLLTVALNEMKTFSGRNNGPEVLNGPFSVGPTANGVPVGVAPIAPVQTPTRESHVLNDAILRAALDLGKRDKARRKVILVVSDGQELGSNASYRDVLRVLETRDIQVQAVVVGGGALPVFRQVGRFHLKEQGFWDLLPKYTKATGGGQIFAELTRNSIEAAYSQITSDVRNQYTMGYPIKSTPSTAYHSIDVIVDKRGLKVSAKDGYYPAPTPK